MLILRICACGHVVPVCTCLAHLCLWAHGAHSPLAALCGFVHLQVSQVIHSWKVVVNKKKKKEGKKEAEVAHLTTPCAHSCWLMFAHILMHGYVAPVCAHGVILVV